MSDVKGYVDTGYLNRMAELMQHIKQQSYTLMQVRPGRQVLDVGCGPGIDTVLLAQCVGPAGHVAGVDYDPAMVAAADARAAEAGVSSWVDHQVADATSLPFADASFDACRAERMLQHLTDPPAAVAEMVRVTRPGGWVVVADTDWGSMSLATDEVETERRLARVKAERLLHNGYAGRRLYGWLIAAGLTSLSVQPFVIYQTQLAMARYGMSMDELQREALAAGAVTADELARLESSLDKAEEAGQFFGSVNVWLVAGQKGVV